MHSDDVEPEIKVGEATAAGPKTRPSSPKWEQNAKARIQSGIKRLSKPTEILREKDAVEADTRLLVNDILVDVLGYDKYENLTAEFAVRGEFADYGIRVDKQILGFVEVKRISTKLAANHLRQVESYALKEGVKWAILTNAQVWQVYHVTAVQGSKSEVTLVFEVDLTSSELKPSQKTELMFLISKEGLTRGKLDEYLLSRNAVSAKTLRPIILSEEVITAIRKAVKARTKFTVDLKELKVALSEMLDG